MPQTNIQTLQRLMERSQLLTPDRREELQKRLSSFSPNQQEKRISRNFGGKRMKVLKPIIGNEIAAKAIADYLPK